MKNLSHSNAILVQQILCKPDGLNGHSIAFNERKNPLKCDICEVRFLNRGELKRHVLMVHEKKNIVQGRRNIQGHGDMSKHILGQSLKNVQFLNIIPTKFKTKLFLSPVSSNTFRCHCCQYKTCDWTCFSRVKLKDHYIAVHKNNKLLNCNRCGSEYSLRNHLNMHIKADYIELLK